MTQADFTVANQTFPNTRAEINTSLQALATNSAGNSAPSTTFANQWWFDSDDNKLYMRNKDNDAWVEILTIGATSDKIETFTATTINGIPFYQGDTGSIYTHDVSSTDSTAQYNTAYGLTALDAITTGDNNVAIGYGSGGTLNTGGNNTILGYIAGADITDDTNNTLIGHRAGNALTDSNNTVVGSDAGYKMTTAASNVVIGHSAAGGGSAMTADSCVLVGATAGQLLTSGSHNTLIGRQAGQKITEGEKNTILGSNAGAELAGDGGDFNILIGYAAGNALTTTNSSIFIGHESGDQHDTESNNLGIGRSALGGSIAGGENNVAVGNYTLDALTSGDDNVATGYQAGTAITTGSKNTCVGKGAGGALTTGDENLILGREAQAAAVDSDNSVTLGSSSISSLRCQVQSISALSDERDKTDIIDLPYGLDFINKTRPVQFKWNIRDKYLLEGNPHQGKTRNGFIAQELAALGNNEQHKLVLQDNPDRLEAAYSGMIPMLVKAVQELSAQVTTLQQELKTIKGE